MLQQPGVSKRKSRTLQELAQRSASLVSFADAISNLLTMFYLFVAIIIFSMAGRLLLEVRGRLRPLGARMEPGRP